MATNLTTKIILRFFVFYLKKKKKKKNTYPGLGFNLII